MGGRRISPNANALTFALKCDIPTLRQAARDTIEDTWNDCEPQTVTECARRLDVGRNAMSRMLSEMGL